MTAEEKELVDFHHGYCVALQDMWQHVDKNNLLAEQIDRYLKTNLEDFLTEIKKMYPVKKTETVKNDIKRDKNGYEK